MTDVIPTGTTPDSEFLFDRMTDVTLSLSRPTRGARILDVASGAGQDAIALSRRGAVAIGAEPSHRMTGMAQLLADRSGAPWPTWVRGWSDALPFATGSFDAAFCKGAIDHFDQPEQAIAEMARVTRLDGRVVLAIANFESLSCRVGRTVDHWRDRAAEREVAAQRDVAARRLRRVYDAPSDHFTRYEVELMREQAGRHLMLEIVQGVSLGWGMPGWSRLVARLPGSLARATLQSLDWLARRTVSLSDVVVLAGRPRRSANTS